MIQKILRIFSIRQLTTRTAVANPGKQRLPSAYLKSNTSLIGTPLKATQASILRDSPRKPYERHRKSITQISWTYEQLEYLKKSISIHGLGNWSAISEDLSLKFDSPLISSAQCRLKWEQMQPWGEYRVSVPLRRLLASSSGPMSATQFVRGNWTDEETEKLSSLIDERFPRSIDWNAIAKAVNSMGISETTVPKSPASCYAQWHYLMTKRNVWFGFEVKRLQQVVAEHGVNDWDLVAKNVGFRHTPLDCFNKWENVVETGRQWTRAEDEKLIRAVQVYNRNWERIAKELPGRTPKECCTRCRQVKRRRWTDAELKLLKEEVLRQRREEKRIPLPYDADIDWIKVCKAVGNGRTLEQCRLKWRRSANSEIVKGRFSEDESRLLVSLVERFGVGNWSEISNRMLNKRSDEQLRHHYHYRALKAKSNRTL